MAHRPSPVHGKAWQQLSFEERLKASFVVNKETGCWEWKKQGAQGYGSIDFEGKTIPAHRASWIFHNGEIKEGLCVLHKCDNRRCINPKHLYLGDKKQNRKDFMERHPRAKEIVAKGQKAGAAGAKRFWESMSEGQKKEFCKRRFEEQMKKNGGKGPRTGCSYKWITDGANSKTIPKNKPIPEGWRRGRLL